MRKSLCFTKCLLFNVTSRLDINLILFNLYALELYCFTTFLLSLSLDSRIPELSVQALDLDPNDGTISPRISYIYYFYGVMMTQEKCDEDAILYFQQAIQFNPLIGQFYVSLATTTTNCRSPPEARRETLRAISVVSVRHKSIVPLIARLFPGKTEEQVPEKLLDN